MGIYYPISFISFPLLFPFLSFFISPSYLPISLLSSPHVILSLSLYTLFSFLSQHTQQLSLSPSSFLSWNQVRDEENSSFLFSFFSPSFSLSISLFFPLIFADFRWERRRRRRGKEKGEDLVDLALGSLDFRVRMLWLCWVVFVMCCFVFWFEFEIPRCAWRRFSCRVVLEKYRSVECDVGIVDSCLI